MAEQAKTVFPTAQEAKAHAQFSGPKAGLYEFLVPAGNGETEQRYFTVATSPEKAHAALSIEVLGVKVIRHRKQRKAKTDRVATILEQYEQSDDPRVQQLISELKAATAKSQKKTDDTPAPPSPPEAAEAPPAPPAG